MRRDDKEEHLSKFVMNDVDVGVRSQKSEN